MTTPIYSLASWPAGVSPFSQSFRDLINRMGTTITWVDANLGDLEALLSKPEEPRLQLPRPMYAILAGNVTFATNRWEYTWDEAELIIPGRTYAIKPDGRSSSDPNETVVLNLTEFKNDNIAAAHGVSLDSPNATGVVEPIPDGTPVLLHFAGVETGGPTPLISRVFSEVNAVNFGCNLP
ncbi:MAG: hypothetical protein V3S55_09465 [Nitrospiraceae bacterium]